MTKYVVIFLVFILLLFGAFIGGRFSVKNKQPKTTVQIDTVTVIRDTTFYEVVKVPTPYYIVDSFPFMVGADFDTMAILSQYYKMLAYNDTMVNDSNATIITYKVVYRNELILDSIRYRINRPTTYVTHTTCDPYKWAAGVTVQGNASYFDASANIYYIKNKNMYGLGFSPFSKQISVSLSRVIK